MDKNVYLVNLFKLAMLTFIAIVILSFIQTQVATAAGILSVPDDSVVSRFERTNSFQIFTLKIIWYFLSLVVFGMGIFTLKDPEEAYMLFRRGLKYENEVELTEFYLDFMKYGTIGSLIMWALVLFFSGAVDVLLAAVGTLALMYGYSKFKNN